MKKSVNPLFKTYLDLSQHASDTGGAAAVTGVYDHNEYLSEKRRALDAWALRLLEIAESKGSASNVVQVKF